LVTGRSGNLLLIRLVHGDDLLEGLKSALADEGVTSGVLLGGVGMLSQARLGYYAGDGEYDTFDVGEEVELCAVNGNISTFEGDYVIHMHVTAGRRDGSAVAGHLVSAKVHMTNELTVMVSETGMVRKVDEETGLKLLWFEG
jgi:predicted DNA-binding protein with PD1-like motif